MIYIQEKNLVLITDFFNIYEDNMNNKVILGYLVHLLTDNLWNKDFYEKKQYLMKKR